MGGSFSKPEETSLECVFKSLKLFTVIVPGLYINWGWKNGLQLDLYHHRMGKWTEVPLCWRLYAPYHNPALCDSHVLKNLRNQKISPNILNDSLLTSPNSERGTKLPPLLKVPILLQILLIKLRPPAPQRNNPCRHNILSASLPLLPGSVWALFSLYFSCETMTTERKDDFFLTGWPQYCLDSRENWLK